MSDFIIFYMTLPKFNTNFSKSASGELSKWQICVQFDRFHSLTIRKGEVC